MTDATEDLGRIWRLSPFACDESRKEELAQREVFEQLASLGQRDRGNAIVMMAQKLVGPDGKPLADAVVNGLMYTPSGSISEPLRTVHERWSRVSSKAGADAVSSAFFFHGIIGIRGDACADFVRYSLIHGISTIEPYHRYVHNSDMLVSRNGINRTPSYQREVDKALAAYLAVAHPSSASPH